MRDMMPDSPAVTPGMGYGNGQPDGRSGIGYGDGRSGSYSGMGYGDGQSGGYSGIGYGNGQLGGYSGMGYGRGQSGGYPGMGYGDGQSGGYPGMEYGDRKSGGYSGMQTETDASVAGHRNMAGSQQAAVPLTEQGNGMGNGQTGVSVMAQGDAAGTGWAGMPMAGQGDSPTIMQWDSQANFSYPNAMVTPNQGGVNSVNPYAADMGVGGNMAGMQGDEECTMMLEQPEFPVRLTACLVRRRDGAVYRMEKERAVVGSGTAADICIYDNHAISRNHAVLSCMNGEYYLEDNQSKNGSFINGRRIQPGVREAVYDGMVLKFANEDFVFSKHGR